MTRTVEEIDKEIARLIMERALAANEQQKAYDDILAEYRAKYDGKWLRVDEYKSGMKSRGLPVDFPGNYWLYRVDTVVAVKDDMVKLGVKAAIRLETYRAGTLFVEGPNGEQTNHVNVPLKDFVNGHAYTVSEHDVAVDIEGVEIRHRSIMDSIRAAIEAS